MRLGTAPFQSHSVTRETLPQVSNIMASQLSAALLTLILVVEISAGEPAALFSGSDLSGWDVYVDGNEVSADEAWTIDHGVLRATAKGQGYVVTDRAYADYILRLDWRWTDGDGGGRANSGVLIHVVGPNKIWPKGIEAQLKTGSAGDFASFEDARSDNEIVSRNPSGVSTGRLPRQVPSPEHAVGEWNTYTITARGGELILDVNGTQVNRLTGVVPSGGHIALQSEGYPIEFRNITLEPLPPAKDLHAPMPQ